MPGTVTYVLVAVLAGLATYVVPPVRHQLKVVGVGRSIASTIPTSDSYIKIPDTIHCEDLHHYQPANLLFAACEDSHIRFSWFPPLLNLNPPPEGTQGSFRVIDPETKKSTKLTFENFEKTFVTHGIDVIEDPRTKDAVYLFAVNHQPNYQRAKTGNNDLPKSNSQIEIFHHVIGTETVKHIRTINHPLIKTPNDIYATSPTTFYVTNDHGYREGLRRTIEEVLPPAGRSDIVYVSVSDLSPSSPNEGVDISVVLTGLQSNNGLGHTFHHGKHTDEIMIVDAVSGKLYLAQANKDHSIKIMETISMDSTLDNPTYFSDPYATPGHDASGHVLAGLARGIDLGGNAADPHARDPPLVWFVRREQHNPNGPGQWEKRIIFSDDSTRIRSASAAVIVAIDPAKEGGEKRGWLFVTGFMSESMVAVKMDLEMVHHKAYQVKETNSTLPSE